MTRLVHCACPAIHLPCIFAHFLACLEVSARLKSVQVTPHHGSEQRTVRTGTARDGTPGAVDQPVKTMRRQAQRISCEPRYPYAFSVHKKSAISHTATKKMKVKDVTT
jgi:hypothetical protein